MKCKLLISIAFSLFWMANLYGQTFTPESVPNTKIQNNSYISDPSNILDEETENLITFENDEMEYAHTKSNQEIKYNKWDRNPTNFKKIVPQ